MSEEPPTSAANPVQQALLPVGGPPSESGTENSVSSSLPLSPMLATSIADESGSDRVIMLDEIVVKQRARWDYKTNMTLGARREHSGRKTSMMREIRCLFRTRTVVVEGNGGSRSSCVRICFPKWKLMESIPTGEGGGSPKALKKKMEVKPLAGNNFKRFGTV
ncbi:hypothetical protein B0H14DRAFT_3550912 [Mycena olivaceomarginata]|nr:hypothetical protein B0H14DRAFT_3550912 [Mycena olivaceomarginata]